MKVSSVLKSQDEGDDNAHILLQFSESPRPPSLVAVDLFPRSVGEKHAGGCLGAFHVSTPLRVFPAAVSESE